MMPRTLRFISYALVLRSICAGAIAAALIFGGVSFAQDKATESKEAAEPKEESVEEILSHYTTTDSDARDLNALTEAAAKYYPELRAQEYRIAAAKARLGEARFSPYTQFTVEATLAAGPGARGTPIFSPDSELPLSNAWKPIYGFGVSGAIPIYTFGKLEGARGAARAGVRAEEFQKTTSLSKVLYDVRRAYFGLQLALDAMQMIDEGKGSLEKALERAQQKLQQKHPDVEESDVWRLETTLAEITARQSEGEKAAFSAQAALQALTGIQHVRVVDCPLSAATADVANVKDDATSIGTRSDLQALDAALEAQRYGLKATRAQFAPDLMFGLSAGYSRAPGITDIENPFIQDGANRRRFTFGLLARWSLDFAGAAFQSKRAKAEMAELKSQYQAATLGVKLEVDTALASLKDAERRELAWRRGYKGARTWFVSAVQGYEVGTTDAKDLIDAVKNYFQARFAHVSAIGDYNLALAQFEKASGRLLLGPEEWASTCVE